MNRKAPVITVTFIIGITTLLTSALGFFIWNVSVNAASRNSVVAPEVEVATTTAQVVRNDRAETVGAPIHIKIPSIGVDATIEPVSVDADGFMDTPKLPSKAAWYEPGPRPGEAGNAVIAGHLDWYGGAKAIFVNLHKLKVGDSIIVRDELGAEHSFIIRGKRNYDAAADATDIFISSDGKARLNLITCSGSWNKKARQYSKRLVIFAESQN